MPLSSGSKLGPYEILSPIGAGGMGEVYRARDSRLGREMAIKVLPEGFASDPERLRRFEIEARAASAISDPHIVSVFDVGSDNGRNFIATELVAGSDLRALLGKPMPVRKALDLAEQIAAGIAAAHERGIIHRDLKPENILVTKSGLVKIADFGLAKLAEIPDADRSGMPTASRVETMEGIVMGTVAYMSPEQAAGRRVDHRSDQFALGVILYEMLTGIGFFRRETAAETLAAVLRDEPEPVGRVNPSVPPPLSWIVERCLAKDPEERYASTRDLARELSTAKAHLSDVYAAAAPAATGRVRGRERVAWAATAILLAAVAAQILRPRRPAGVTGPIRASIVLTEQSDLRAAVLSPDGTKIALVARDPSGTSLLAVRPIDSLAVRPLPGTENSTYPFWSPDGRFIAFFADGKLKKVDPAGGTPQTIADAPIARGGSWSRDGVILFSPVPDGPLYRVPAAGGPATPVTRLDPGRRETSHRWPFFLPDGKHFLYEVTSFGPDAQAAKMGIYAGALDSREEQLLARVRSNPAFVSPSGDSRGYVLFVRDQDLFAQRFDASAMRLEGDPIAIAERVEYFPEIHEAAYSASRNGMLLYRSRSSPRSSQLTWFDRSGRRLETLGDPGNAANPHISPDGKRVALDIIDPQTGNLDIWAYETAGGIPSRLTSDPALDSTPVWSPDGTRIVFTSMRRNRPDIFRKNASGAGADEAVLLSDEIKFATDWSPDGRFILYSAVSERSNFGLWTMPAAADHRPTPFLREAYGAKDGQFSPDGKWVAYAANESGKWEIYVAPFPGPGGNWKVSTRGGTEPRWRRDGKELFYLAPDGKLMAVGVKPGPEFEAESATPLFRISRPDPVSSTDLYCYDVSNDGRRFLVNMEEGDASPPSLTLIVNWIAGIGR